MRWIIALMCLALPSLVAAQDMTFATHSNGGNCGGCSWTSAQGTITQDTPDQFRKFLADNGPLGDIVFHSPGGNLGAALKLGRLIREAGFATGVGETTPLVGSNWFNLGEGLCESACAFAYMGGVARSADDKVGFNPRIGKIGMHQFYTPGGDDIPSTATQRIMGQLLIYMIDMGINAEALSLASNATQGEMYYFTPEELRRLGLHTEGARTSNDLVVHRGGLALKWVTQLDNKPPSKIAHIYCDLAEKSWMLSVHDVGTAGSSLGFDPENPKDLSFALGGERKPNIIIPIGGAPHPMDKRHIKSLSEEGQDRLITVRLPVDLREFSGQEFLFRTNLLRNFQTILMADGTLPDQDTLSVMARACANG